VEIKGPPLKDNLLRKKKPTPSGLFSDAAHPLWVGVTSLFCDVGILFFVFRFFFFCLVPSLRWRPRRSRHLWRPNGRPRRPGGPARARRPR
jgi:hypothetical protein